MEKLYGIVGGMFCVVVAALMTHAQPDLKWEYTVVIEMLGWLCGYATGCFLGILIKDGPEQD